MKTNKKELEPGVAYFLQHKEEGNMICIFDKYEPGKLIFNKVMGGMDFRLKIKVKPNLARYFKIPILDEEE